MLELTIFRVLNRLIMSLSETFQSFRRTQQINSFRKSILESRKKICSSIEFFDNQTFFEQIDKLKRLKDHPQEFHFELKKLRKMTINPKFRLNHDNNGLDLVDFL